MELALSYLFVTDLFPVHHALWHSQLDVSRNYIRKSYQNWNNPSVSSLKKVVAITWTQYHIAIHGFLCIKWAMGHIPCDECHQAMLPRDQNNKVIVSRFYYSMKHNLITLLNFLWV